MKLFRFSLTLALLALLMASTAARASFVNITSKEWKDPFSHHSATPEGITLCATGGNPDFYDHDNKHKDGDKDGDKDSSKDGSRDDGKDGGKDHSNDDSKDDGKDGGKEHSNDGSKDDGKDGGKKEDHMDGFYTTGHDGHSVKLTEGHDGHGSGHCDVSPVPLPGAMILFGSALLGLFGFRRFS